MNAEEIRFAEYLNDKYGKEFTVKDVKVRSAGLGVPGQLAGRATPANDNSLVFEVGKSRSEGGKYFDGYTGAVWAREERPRVEAFLKTIYGENVPQFNLITHIPTAAAPDPIRGNVPSIDEAMEKYRDNFFYSLMVKTTVSHELSQSEIDTQTRLMKEVIRFVLEKEASHPVVRYAINIEGQNTGYLCSISQKLLIDTNKINNCLEKIGRKAW